MNEAFNPARLAVEVNRLDHVLGPESARATVVEYGDFECPSCAQAYPAVKMMLRHYGDSVRFVFRHYPLREVHPHAELAAEAAEAAGAQHKFWPMYNLLFENRLHLDEKNLRQYAEKAELDMALYDDEMNKHVHLQRIQEVIESGKRSQVRATPTFFVNGIMHDVSYGIEHLQPAIEAVLRG